MAAPIVYRWDDSGAPVARGERASLCDILYACLVTGYGSKSAAGWTREYVNGTYDKAVFRNNPVTGTGFYLQVDGAGAANAYTPKLQGFEVMTSESDGLSPFNATVQTTQTSNAANTTARPWVLIADDRAFWFLCWNSIATSPTAANTGCSGMFFGDFIKRLPDDAFACGLFGGNNYYGMTPTSGMLSASATTIGVLAVPRKATGAVGTSHLAGLVRGCGPAHEQVPGYNGLAYSAGDQILITRPYVNENVAYSFRGYLPGFFYPCHPLAFGQLESVTDGDFSWLSLRYIVGGTTENNIFISLNDWRA